MLETNNKGEYTVKLKNGTYTVEVTKEGFDIATGSVTVNGATATVTDIKLAPEAQVETEKISSEDIGCSCSNFPSVVKYEMKGDNKGKTFYGQTKAIDTVKINDVAIKLGKDNVEG